MVYCNKQHDKPADKQCECACVWIAQNEHKANQTQVQDTLIWL